MIGALFASAPALSQQALKVALLENSKNMQPAITALYKEAGLVPEFVVLPAERALKSVESGEKDADLGRVVGGTAGYKNLVKCSESMSEINLLAVVKKGSAITRVTPADL